MDAPKLAAPSFLTSNATHAYFQKNNNMEGKVTPGMKVTILEKGLVSYEKIESFRTLVRNETQFLSNQSKPTLEQRQERRRVRLHQCDGGRGCSSRLCLAGGDQRVQRGLQETVSAAGRGHIGRQGVDSEQRLRGNVSGCDRINRALTDTHAP